MTFWALEAQRSKLDHAAHELTLRFADDDLKTEEQRPRAVCTCFSSTVARLTVDSR